MSAGWSQPAGDVNDLGVENMANETMQRCA